MNNTGYTLLTKDQLNMLYGNNSSYEDPVNPLSYSNDSGNHGILLDIWPDPGQILGRILGCILGL
uniref:Uncharacterized protein n=1 Tax=Meloidogyne incognita TaxID=6306 RepID=A0A914KVL0_MELIC